MFEFWILIPDKKLIYPTLGSFLESNPMQVSLLTSGSLFSTSSFLTRPFSRLILLRSTIDDTSSSVTMPKSFMSDVARAEAHRSLTWYLKHLFFKKHFLVQRSKSHIWRGGEDFCYSDSRVFWIQIRNTDPGPFKIRKSLQKMMTLWVFLKHILKYQFCNFLQIFSDFVLVLKQISSTFCIGCK